MPLKFETYSGYELRLELPRSPTIMELEELPSAARGYLARLKSVGLELELVKVDVYGDTAIPFDGTEGKQRWLLTILARATRNDGPTLFLPYGFARVTEKLSFTQLNAAPVLEGDLEASKVIPPVLYVIERREELPRRGSFDRSVLASAWVTRVATSDPLDGLDTEDDLAGLEAKADRLPFNESLRQRLCLASELPPQSARVTSYHLWPKQPRFANAMRKLEGSETTYNLDELRPVTFSFENKLDPGYRWGGHSIHACDAGRVSFFGKAAYEPIRAVPAAWKIIEV